MTICLLNHKNKTEYVDSVENNDYFVSLREIWWRF